MEVITDGSGDGITLPFSASLACDASFIERPCDSCRRHPIVFNLPGHVVNHVLFKPIRNEHSIAVDIPQGDLVPNWNEQNVIDYMYWQVERNGMSATSVAKNLNKEGLRGKRGGNWSATSVLKVLRNPFHERRKKFPYPERWGAKPWQRYQ